MNNANEGGLAPRALSAAELTSGFVSVVDDLALIAVSGDDAANFLHSQLSNDVSHLAPGQVRLAGYCSPKGRLLASFLMWRDAEAIFLQLPASLAPALNKRLSMFVMRAKAKLAIMDGQVALGLGGVRAEPALRAIFGDMPSAPYRAVDTPSGSLIRVADVFGSPRYQWLATADVARSFLPKLAETLALGNAESWRLSDIHAGIPQITLGTQEKFVPQMINYELIGGVDFKKGCYPGQEIVARSQYLGKVKRRAVIATVAGASAAAGDELFSAIESGQPCGMVVNAAANGAGGVDLLVEIQLSSLGADIVHLGAADGPELVFLAMPYPVVL